MMETNPLWQIEPVMYSATKEMFKHQRTDSLVSQSIEKQKQWRESKKCFATRENGELTQNRYRVSTTELVMKLLGGEHVTEKGHFRKISTLRNCLADTGLVLPPFIGPLERVVNVLL